MTTRCTPRDMSCGRAFFPFRCRKEKLRQACLKPSRRCTRQKW